jgi:putative hemolysin
MSSFAANVLLVLLLILANGLFAMAEMALVSARRGRLQTRAEDGDRGAQAALELAEDPNRFLSTVQIGITLIGILSGAFGGAVIAEYIAGWLRQITWLAPYAEAVSLGLVVLVITYLSLVLGELAPKRLALRDAERLAAGLARPMQVLSRVTAPLVRFLSRSTDAVLRLLGAGQPIHSPLTDEEVHQMLDEGGQSGLFEGAELDMLKRVLRLGDRRVTTMMTYRQEVVWIDIDASEAEILDKFLAHDYAWFPVARGDLDNVIGLLSARQYWLRCVQGECAGVGDTLNEPLYVPEAMDGLELLERFRQARAHLALVVDEYGGLVGLVTLDDVLAAILGSLPATGGEAESPAVRREDGSWLMDGALTVDEVKDLLDLEALPGEEEVGYETLGGLMMAYLGRIPHAGDHFEWGGLRFEVMDMDGRRVDKVLVAFTDD